MEIKIIEALIFIREILTEGHSPLMIVGNDFQKYIAKNGKGQVPPITVINECLANYLLHCWDIFCPDYALIKFDSALIQENSLSLYHRLRYYEELTFGTKLLENIIDVNDFSYSNRKTAYNKFLNPMDFFHIALFDTWIENDDRKPTNYNLILQPIRNKFNIVPIDHSFIFSTLKYTDLDPEMYSPIDNEHLLVSELGYLLKQFTTFDANIIEKEKQYFYLCVDNCKKTFSEFFIELSKYFIIDQDSISKIEEYLFNEERNRKVFEEYIYRLKQ